MSKYDIGIHIFNEELVWNTRRYIPIRTHVFTVFIVSLLTSVQSVVYNSRQMIKHSV